MLISKIILDKKGGCIFKIWKHKNQLPDFAKFSKAQAPAPAGWLT
jgi:hypothetical protein